MVSKEIAKYKTDKKSMFMSDRLVLAEVDNFAEIWSEGGKGRIPATIGVAILNHAKEPSVSVAANFSPSEVKRLFAYIQKVSMEGGDWEWQQTAGTGKIVAAVKDKDGYSPVKNIQLIRQELDKDGKKRGYPWFVRITNGLGIAQTRDTGGTVIKSGSFKKTGEEFVSLKDEDIYDIFDKVCSYIELWKLANAIPNIKAGQSKFMQELEERKKVG